MIRTKKRTVKKDTLNKAEIDLLQKGLSEIYFRVQYQGLSNKLMESKRQRLIRLNMKLLNWTPHQKKKLV